MKKKHIHQLIRRVRKEVKGLHKKGAFGALALVLGLAFAVCGPQAFAVLQQQSTTQLDGGGGGSYDAVPKSTLPSETTNTLTTNSVDVSTEYTNVNGAATTGVTGNKWETQIPDTFWYAWNRNLGYAPSSDTQTTGWATALSDPDIQIGYDFVVYDANNNVIQPGGTVTNGQHVTLKFNKYVSDDIYWFGTGTSMDSPYGDWSANAAPPARSGTAMTCNDKDWVQQYIYDPSGAALQFDVYIPLEVNPPTRSLTVPSGMSCGSLTTNSDGSVSASCTISASTGTLTPYFNYSSTYGKFYYRYKDYRDMTGIGWGPAGCYGNNIPLTSSSQTGWGQPSGPTAESVTTIEPAYQLNVPAESFPYALKVGTSANTAPNAPTLTCPSSVGLNTDVSVTLKATDPQGDNVSYAMDWTGDKTLDSGWSAYVTSGTSKTLTKTGGYATAGTYTVYGAAKDVAGLQSTLSSCTINVTATGPTASLTATPGSVNSGSASTLSWSSTNATSCTGTNFSTGNATSGSVSTGALTADKTYSVSCTGSGGTATDQATVTVTNSLPDLTAGNIPSTSTTPGTIPLSSLIANGGTVSTGASFYVLFQTASTSSGTNAKDLGKVQSSALAAGASARQTYNATFSVGTYFVRACADKSSAGNAGVIAESDETNNCGDWRKITVNPPGPNLQAATPTLSDGTPAANEQLTLTSTAKNIGTDPTGDFPVLFQITDSNFKDVDLVDSDYLTGLAAGASAPASVSYAFASTGTYYVRACANENTSKVNIVTETNYGDNCSAYKLVTVKGAASSLSCSVTPTTIGTSGGTAKYAANGGRAGDIYTWLGSDGSQGYGIKSIASRTFAAGTNGSYGMQVTDTTQNSQADCPVVAVGNSCSALTGTLTADPTRVRSGQPTTLSWQATGVGTSCTVTGPGVSQTDPAASCTLPQSSVLTPGITAQSVYTLTCDGKQVDQVIVNVIPAFQEF